MSAIILAIALAVIYTVTSFKLATLKRKHDNLTQMVTDIHNFLQGRTDYIEPPINLDDIEIPETPQYLKDYHETNRKIASGTYSLNSSKMLRKNPTRIPIKYIQ